MGENRTRLGSGRGSVAAACCDVVAACFSWGMQACRMHLLGFCRSRQQGVWCASSRVAQPRCLLFACLAVVDLGAPSQAARGAEGFWVMVNRRIASRLTSFWWVVLAASITSVKTRFAPQRQSKRAFRQSSRLHVMKTVRAGNCEQQGSQRVRTAVGGGFLLNRARLVPTLCMCAGLHGTSYQQKQTNRPESHYSSDSGCQAR